MMNHIEGDLKAIEDYLDELKHNWNKHCGNSLYMQREGIPYIQNSGHNSGLYSIKQDIEFESQKQEDQHIAFWDEHCNDPSNNMGGDVARWPNPFSDRAIVAATDWEKEMVRRDNERQGIKEDEPPALSDVSQQRPVFFRTINGIIASTYNYASHSIQEELAQRNG